MDKSLLKEIALGFAIGFSLFHVWKILPKKSQKIVKRFRDVQIAILELGGTSCKMAIGKIFENNGTDSNSFKVEILEKSQIETTNPEETLNKIIKFLNKHTFFQLNIGTFGPLQLNTNLPNYGSITSSPKEKWIGFNLREYFLRNLKSSLSQNLIIKMETDVNTCAIGEFRLGNHEVKNSLAYITVGTGVGIGFIVNGKPVHGLIHPEGGHVK